MLTAFLNHLVEKNLIKESKVRELARRSEKELKSIEKLIVEDKIILEKELFKKKSDFLKIPLIEEVNEKIKISILEEIPEETAKHYEIIPIKREGNILKIAMVNPENFLAKSAIDFISKQRGVKVKIFLLSFSEFDKAFKKYNAFKKQVAEAVEELEENVEITTKEKEDERVIEEAPISKIVGVILRHAVEGKASDIHIEPYNEKLRVRFRMDGTLYASLYLKKKVLPSIVSRIKILSNLRIDETRMPQDGRFQAVVSERKINFRVATFPTPEGEKVVIRVLDPTSAVVGFSNLGIKGRNVKLLEDVIKSPFGMILLCGPTGSGKTTTQYTILDKLNKEDVNIVTLEDPVEYWMTGVNQSQIKPDIGYTFASGLRQILRQDPDIIMVGEIRDEETASLAVHAALTGHLVLSTLHANNAIGVIPRLTNMGVESFLLPAALKAAVSQRLVRRLCDDCKIRIEANTNEKKVIEEEIRKLPEEEKKNIKMPDPIYIYKPRGCSKCAQKGTKGRIGLYETLIMSEEIEEIIFGKISESKIATEAKRQGMVTMRQDGIIKVLEGVVSIDEVLKVVEANEEESLD